MTVSRSSSRCGSVERHTPGDNYGHNGHNDSNSDLNSLINNFRALTRFQLDDQCSDKSEASSVCSERSHQSTSDRQLEDVKDIIANLRSTHWSTRKEGLLSFQFYLKHSPSPLNNDQLSSITKQFTMMLLDPHTKTFSLFLEILNELIRAYKDYLTDWLYVLLTRLFLKIGSDILSSVQARVLNTLNIVRECFLREDQFNVIVRFLSDQAQTPSMKVKLTVLQYFNDLLVQMEPSEWRYDEHSKSWHELQLCLMKIISWTSDQKSSELKSYAAEVLINFLNLNTPKFFSLLVQLPKTYQDAAYKIIQGEKKPAEEFSVLNDSYSKKMLKSVDCTMFLMPSQETEMLMNMTTRTMNATLGQEEGEQQQPQQGGEEGEEEDDFSQEDYYSSLKKTTDEINRFTSEIGQNRDYSDEALSLPKNGGNSQTPSRVGNGELLVEDHNGELAKTANSSSMDSGISQIDGLASKEPASTLPPYSPAKSSPEAIIQSKPYTLEASIQSKPYTPEAIIQSKPHTPPRTLPRAHVFVSRLNTFSCRRPQPPTTVIAATPTNNLLNGKNKYLDLMNNNVKPAFDYEDEPADLSAIFTSVDQQQQEKDQQSKQRSLKELILKIQQKSNANLWPKYFKRTLYFLFNCIDDRIQPELTLNALSELLINHPKQFEEHIDLFMVKLLQFSKVFNKELSSLLDHCYNGVGAVLPFDKCVPILLVTIVMNEFPENQIALKVLTKVSFVDLIEF